MRILLARLYKKRDRILFSMFEVAESSNKFFPTSNIRAGGVLFLMIKHTNPFANFDNKLKKRFVDSRPRFTTNLNPQVIIQGDCYF